MTFGFRTTVVDNSDDNELAREARAIASEFGARYLPALENLGWGAAINFWLSRTPDRRPFLLVAAHDAKIEHFDSEEIVGLLSGNDVFSVSPENGTKKICNYSHTRFFYFAQGRGKCGGTAYEVPIGHSTAIMFKTSAVELLQFDEEFFIYGCESEIFIRALKTGLKTIQTPSFQVRNPSTDTARELVSTAFLVNSLYCAHTHGGVPGLLLRSLRIMLSTVRDARLKKIRLVAWAWRNPQKGFRTYRRRSVKKVR